MNFLAKVGVRVHPCFRISVCFWVIPLLGWAHTAWSELVTWRPPAGTPSNAAWSVSVRAEGDNAWKELFVYAVPIGHQSQRDPLMARGGIPFRGPVAASLVLFDFDGAVEVRAVFRKGPLATWAVTPAAYSIPVAHTNNALHFTVRQDAAAPRKIVVRANDNWEEDCLHILTNPPETDAPRENDPDVLTIAPGDAVPRALPEGKKIYYFKPGVHTLPRGLWIDFDMGDVRVVDRCDIETPLSRGSIEYGAQKGRIEYRTSTAEPWRCAVEELWVPAGGGRGLAFPPVSGRFFRLILLGNRVEGRSDENLRASAIWINANRLSAFRLYRAGTDTPEVWGKVVACALPDFEKLNDGSGSLGHTHAGETFFIAADGVTVYLAPGAVVRGAIGAEKRAHLSIRGRGILDGSTLVHYPEALHRGKTSVIHIENSRHILLEGLTIRDSPCWGIVLNGAVAAHVKNIHYFGAIVNADGVHMSAVTNGKIEGCFLRATDDLFCAYHYGPARNVVMRNCVLWSDGARVVLLGLGKGRGGQPADIEEFVFENLDILNVQNVWDMDRFGGAFHLHATSGHTIRDITFRDIRLEPFRAPSIASLLQIKAVAMWKGRTLEYAPGHVRDITFENIIYRGDGEYPSYLQGSDPEHKVVGVRLGRVLWGGRMLTGECHPKLEIRDFAEGVLFSGECVAETP